MVNKIYEIQHPWFSNNNKKLKNWRTKK
jgi:hypothetical protein